MMGDAAANNLLFFGDNLDVLHQHIKDESVDLIYLDPPFNSNANYNVPLGPPKGRTGIAASIRHSKHAQPSTLWPAFARTADRNAA